MKKILINKEVWQTRVAILSDDRLQDIYFDTPSKENLERCFFKGKVSKVLPGIQTAFVDIGKSKAGFLHITEVDRALATEKVLEFLQVDEEDDISEREIKTSLDIGKIFTENDSILVQVIKEPIHEKGAKLTTCYTLPGKFIVLMPNIPQIGISRKIEDKTERTRLKELVTQCIPNGMGAIVRTTAENRTKNDIERDLGYLIDTWNTIQKKYKRAETGELLYEDLPLSVRVIRDHLDEDVESVIIDDTETQNNVHKFIKSFTPELAHKIRFYEGPPSLFQRFNVEEQIEKALQKKVSLKSGGTLIIESTEAMSVVDVNTGKFIGSDNLEDTILKTNLEAADEIVTQLRLRNIGGLIVIDFIDMSSSTNRQKLSRFLEKKLKEKDKYQSVTLKISEFGIIQMTRKRSGKTLMQQLTNVCPTCSSCGFIKSVSTQSFEILRKAKEEVIRHGMQGSIIFSVSLKVFDYLIHHEYHAILEFEKKLKCKVILESNEKLEGLQFHVSPFEK
ncbi:MAG: Rne/Rng family ribonuclease [bacterium]